MYSNILLHFQIQKGLKKFLIVSPPYTTNYKQTTHSKTKKKHVDKAFHQFENRAFISMVVFIILTNNDIVKCKDGCSTAISLSALYNLRSDCIDKAL